MDHASKIISDQVIVDIKRLAPVCVNSPFRPLTKAILSVEAGLSFGSSPFKGKLLWNQHKSLSEPKYGYSGVIWALLHSARGQAGQQRCQKYLLFLISPGETNEDKQRGGDAARGKKESLKEMIHKDYRNWLAAFARTVIPCRTAGFWQRRCEQNCLLGPDWVYTANWEKGKKDWCLRK